MWGHFGIKGFKHFQSMTLGLIFVLIPFLVNILSVSAGTGCYNGHPDCRVNFVDNCDVRGSWTMPSGTHTLPTGINMCQSGITLDCAGATLQGTNLGFNNGIMVYFHPFIPPFVGNVTIRNCGIRNYYDGIKFFAADTGPGNNKVLNNIIYSNSGNGISISHSSGHVILYNTIYDNPWGIDLYSSRNNQITNNNIYNNFYYGVIVAADSHNNTLTSNQINSNGRGIYISVGRNNAILGNTINSNRFVGVDFGGNFGPNTLFGNTMAENKEYDLAPLLNTNQCSYSIDNNIGSGGRPIKFVNVSTILQNEAYSELIICNSDNSEFSNIIVDGSPTETNNGIFIIGSDNSKFRNLVSSNNRYGVHLRGSKNNTVENIVANYNNKSGIYVSGSSNNSFIDSIVLFNSDGGIYCIGSHNNTIINSTVSRNNNTGINIISCLSSNLTSNRITDNEPNGILVAGQALLSLTKNTELVGNLVEDNSAVGILVNSYAINTSIMENAIMENRVGIYINMTNFSIIFNNTITHNILEGINIQDSNQINISKANNISRNSRSGVHVNKSYEITIDNNSVTYNNDSGISLYTSIKTKIIQNKILNNSKDGISTYNSSLNNITNNYISDSLENGIRLDLGNSNNIIDNILIRNVRHGINLTNSNFNLIRDNNASLNKHPNAILNESSGISLTNSSFNSILYNVVHNNSWVGINLEENSDSNIVNNNNVFYNGDDGIGSWSSAAGGCPTFSIENNTFNNNQVWSNEHEGIHLYCANQNLVKYNNVYDNYLSGIALMPWRACTCTTRSNRVENNRVVNNGINLNGIPGSAYDGIILVNSINNVIILNNVTTNAQNGIRLITANDNIVDDNEIHSNRNDGINLLGSLRNVFRGNSVKLNNLNGIRLTESAENIIGPGILFGLSNIINNNVQHGIYFERSNENIIQSNQINYNGQKGIYLYFSFDNGIFDNSVIRNALEGIHLFHSSNLNSINDNVVDFNMDNGIKLESSANENIYVNEVCFNGGKPPLDFNLINSPINLGDNNMCDLPDGWNDFGIIGCTFPCSARPINLSDFGDAPDPPYPSLNRSNGARHLNPGIEKLGYDVSVEQDAKIIDLDEFDDGFAPRVIRSDANVSINVTITVFDNNSIRYKIANLTLNGWFDWDNNGNWNESEKEINMSINASLFSNRTEIINVNFTTPNVANGTYWIRIRLAYGEDTNVTGAAQFGEVEDYSIRIGFNNPPILQNMTNIYINETQIVVLDVNATDIDNDTLIYYTNSAIILPSNFSFNNTDGLFIWRPIENDSGNYTISFNVTDSQLWDTENVTVTVNDRIIGCRPPVEGNWIINETCSISEIVLVNGEVIITEYGSLISTGGGLLINGSYDGENAIIINGTLNATDSVFKSLNANYSYRFWVEKNAVFVLRDSVVNNAGYDHPLHRNLGIHIDTDNAILSNNEIVCTELRCSGVILETSSNSLISNNLINISGSTGNSNGIYVLDSSSNNLLLGNVIYSYGREGNGIYITDAPNNFVVNNSIHQSGDFDAWGLIFYLSPESLAIGNIINTYEERGLGIYIQDSQVSLKDNFVKTLGVNADSIYLDNSGTTSIIDSYINASGYDIYLRNSGDYLLLNTTFDKDDVYFDPGVESFSDKIEFDDSETLIPSSARITVRWYVDNFVKYLNNTPASAASVSGIATQPFELLEFAGLTNLNGYLLKQNATEYIQNISGKAFWTPHLVNASKDNFTSRLDIFNIDRNKVINLTLRPIGRGGIGSPIFLKVIPRIFDDK